ncbi:MAG: S8 family serine peptidase [Anaerolineae bacterium]|nr:S8 family serine peptidase [Anaerolineae bacterium]
MWRQPATTQNLPARQKPCHSWRSAPARLDTVLGVGALDKSGMRANFSNAPDNPAAIGLMTLGSLVGPMFDIDNNAMDFAEWGGTSFATPVITGLIAKLMGEYGFDFSGRGGGIAECRARAV